MLHTKVAIKPRVHDNTEAALGLVALTLGVAALIIAAVIASTGYSIEELRYLMQSGF